MMMSFKASYPSCNNSQTLTITIKHSQCDVSCTDTRTCENIIINPPQNESLFNLMFTGFGALYGVTYPIYAVDDYAPFNLSCDYYGQCRRMNIICPQYAQCNIDCIEKYACLNVCYFYLMIVSQIDIYTIFVETINTDKDYMAVNCRIGTYKLQW